MIRYLVIATVLILVAACGETVPTPWPTTTPVPASESSSDSVGGTEAESTEVPGARSDDAETKAPAGASGDVATVAPSDTKSEVSSMAESGAESGAEVVTTESGLQIKDLVVGTGEQARDGAIVSVHYTGWLVDGTKFDSSVDKGTPFEFPLGQGRVIKGWDEGVATMRVGGKRELTIPPDLAYGDRSAGAIIKPGSTLFFEIELLEVKDP